MTEQEEKDYMLGRRMAHLSIIRQLISSIGYEENNPEHQLIALITEREEALRQLRELCEAFGDNDWPEDLHLSDIIEKHLGRYLWDSEGE